MDLLKDFLRQSAGLGLLHIRVMQHGKLVASADFEEVVRRNQYSVTKSFTSVAVGIGIEEGLLSLDEKLADAFATDLPPNPSPNLLAATVRDTLTMCLGQSKPCLMGAQRAVLREKDWVRHALAQPFDQAPNTHYVYSGAGPYLAGILLQRRAGCNLVDYLMPRLFEPLGILRPSWECDPQGNSVGQGGLFITVEELLVFTQMLLQKGSWQGRQLVPQAWLAQAGRKQVENGRDGYGYLFWRGPMDSYRCDGKYEQYGIVMQQQDAAIVTGAESHADTKLRTLVEQYIMPLL